MKTLIVYYSFEGNTEFVAKQIAEITGGDVEKLQLKNEIKTHGFMKYVWGGRQAFMKEKPEILPLEKKIDEYDLVFIGTPVWAWTYSPPINTFLSETKFQNKKIALFCCHGGGMRNTLVKMKEKLSGNEIVGEINFREPLKGNKELIVGNIIEWVKKIVG